MKGTVIMPLTLKSDKEVSLTHKKEKIRNVFAELLLHNDHISIMPLNFTKSKLMENLILAKVNPDALTIAIAATPTTNEYDINLTLTSSSIDTLKHQSISADDCQILLQEPYLSELALTDSSQRPMLRKLDPSPAQKMICDFIVDFYNFYDFKHNNLQTLSE